MKPTDEQAYAIDLFDQGDDLVVEACAGSGKTATLVMMAEAAPQLSGRYAVFNKALQLDAEKRFPQNVKVSTFHSLAFGGFGWRFKDRFKSGRMKSWEIASKLGLDAFVVPVQGGEKRLGAPFLAGHVMKALRNFCQSADPEPSVRHFNYIDGLDEPYADGKRSYTNNNALSAYLLPYLTIAWADAQDPHGTLKYDHGYYLKMYELSNPNIGTDFILIDEAQDLPPVIDSIFAQQTEAQRIYVGDQNQSIYGFTGAQDSIAKVLEQGMRRSTLTQSFRFGQGIADKANEILSLIPGNDMQITGREDLTSQFGYLEEPVAFLTRTNAAAISRLFKELDKGGKPHLMGGGEDVIWFAEGALELMENGHTGYSELACFDSWDEVKQYVAEDQQGEDLRLMVKIMDDFGPQAIIDALKNQPKEADASIVLSTAHKVKGREWETVTLGPDFRDKEKSVPEELRLGYVAVTRAQHHLDHLSFPLLSPPTVEQPVVETAS